MSNPAAASSPRPGGRILWAVLVLTPLLSIALSALLVLSILHFLAQVPTSAVAEGRVGDPRLLRDIVAPFTQQGTVGVKRFSGIVYYPVPYATPPHLTLTSRSGQRSYAILRQDEFGFVWMVDVPLKDVKNLAGAFKDAKDLKDVAGALTNVPDRDLPKLSPGEAFTWEARGVRPFTSAAAIPPFQQHGTLTVPPKAGRHEQVEHFPHPYATPPNVTLPDPQGVLWKQSGASVKILGTTPIGFRWQAENHTNLGSPVTVRWLAKGIRATPAQVAEFAKNPPGFATVIEEQGKLTYASGEQGAVGFERPFASPPRVEVEPVIVTEITTQGFKWKHPGDKRPPNPIVTANWVARGVAGPGMGKRADRK
jgi:hypothetical protein